MQCGKGLMFCLHRTFDTGYWMLPTLGSNVAAAGLRMQRWPPFFGRLGRTEEHDRKGQDVKGTKRSCDGRARFASHPRKPSGPKGCHHISRVSGPGHHQLSVIGCAIVTVSSIAVTL